MSYVIDHDPNRHTLPAMTLFQLRALGRGPGSITVEYAGVDARTPWTPEQPALQILVDVDEHIFGDAAHARHEHGALVVGRVFGTPLLMAWLPGVRDADDQAVVDAVDGHLANLLLATEVRARMAWRTAYVELCTADIYAGDVGWARVRQVWNPWPDDAVDDGQQLAARVHQRIEQLGEWEDSPHLYTQSRRHSAKPLVVRTS